MVGDRNQKALLRVLAGETLSPPPLWLMRQAGRYLPEYRALRQKAGSFLNLCFTPELATEITLQPIRRFDLDAAILFSDILVIPHALGQTVSFVEGEGPVLAEFPGMTKLAKVDRETIRTMLDPVCETISRLRDSLASSKTLIGFAGAPWTVATYMLNRRGGMQDELAQKTAPENPDMIDGLIDLLVERTSDYLTWQIEAGAEVIQLFDTWAGALSHENCRRWSLEPMRRIAQAVKASSKPVPVIVFPRGVGTLYEAYAAEPAFDGLSLDWTVPVTWAHEQLQSRKAVQGNLDPLKLVAGGEVLAEAVEKILGSLGQGPLIFNLGHGIIPETPPEHVADLVALVRGWAP
jgi:uroporphyrinogen decarboxylase